MLTVWYINSHFCWLKSLNNTLFVSEILQSVDTLHHMFSLYLVCHSEEHKFSDLIYKIVLHGYLWARHLQVTYSGFWTHSFWDQIESISKVWNVHLNLGNPPCPGGQTNQKIPVISTDMKLVYSSKTCQRRWWCCRDWLMASSLSSLGKAVVAAASLLWFRSCKQHVLNLRWTTHCRVARWWFVFWANSSHILSPQTDTLLSLRSSWPSYPYAYLRCTLFPLLRIRNNLSINYLVNVCKFFFLNYGNCL